jgi:purine nucleosidase
MTNMILDLDTGIDDSIALFLAATSSEVNLLGVVGTYGNVTTDVGARNSLSILALAGREDVPVFEGQYHSLTSNYFYPNPISQRIHGKNGTGNIGLPEARRSVEKGDGVDWLAGMMRQYDGELVYVATGPLTNLATALKREPALKDFKGRVVSMGGALTVLGNVSHYAEANISQDPEAAKLCYESGLDITLVGLDVTMRSRLTKSDALAWAQAGTQEAVQTGTQTAHKAQAGTLLSQMLLYYIENTRALPDSVYVHDPSAVICALHPDFFTILPLPLTVETEGEDRGRTVVSTARITQKNCPTKACLDVNSTKVEEYIRHSMAGKWA